MNNDFTITLGPQSRVEHHGKHDEEHFRVTLADTGPDTMTGGRIKRIERYVDDDTFMATYGDGLLDVNIAQLLAFHRAHGKLATITSVRPISRFGILELDARRPRQYLRRKAADGRLDQRRVLCVQPACVRLFGRGRLRTGTRAAWNASPPTASLWPFDTTASFWQWTPIANTKRSIEYGSRAKRLGKYGKRPAQACHVQRSLGPRNRPYRVQGLVAGDLAQSAGGKGQRLRAGPAYRAQQFLGLAGSRNLGAARRGRHSRRRAAC